MSTPKIKAFGINFNAATTSEAIELMHAQVTARKSSLTTTPNLNHLLRINRDSALCDLYRQSTLIFCDGAWPRLLINISQRKRIIPERVAGVDLVAQLLAHRARFSFFAVGGTPEMISHIQGMPETLGRIVGHNPAPALSLDDVKFCTALATEIIASNAQIVLLCVGSPKQELLFKRYLSQVPGVFIGAGASLELISAHRRRAPHWVQRAGLEWLFRFLQEPTRLFRRYFFDALHLPRLFISAALRKI